MGKRSKVESGTALLLYAAASIALFGAPILFQLPRWYVGWGADPASHVWFLAWWPHAIAKGMNPFVTHAIWAPTGYDLAGSTSVPGPSLLLAPVTALAGPVASYNLLALAAPAFSAWGAFFLCRRLTHRFLPSVVGGYLFGFSTYELGQLTGHPNLALVVAVPLCVLLVVRRLEGDLGAATFVALLALALVGQFLVSTEVFLTMTLFGGAAILLAWAFVPARRTALVRATALIGVAYVAAAVPLAPYLYYAARTAAHSPVYSFYPSFYSTDALNLVVPTRLTFVGRERFASVAGRFSGNISEQGAYMSLPLLVGLGAFAAARWRERETRFLVALFAVVLVASVGPRLRVGGAGAIPFPWAVFAAIPPVKYALPARFMVYAFLIVAVAVALWLAAPIRAPGRSGAAEPPWARWAVVGLAVAMLLPNLDLPVWRTRVDTPPFFAAGLYRTRIPAGSNILVIPYGDRGNSMLWQAQTSFAFRMAEGYASVVPPPQFARWPILKTLYDGDPVPQSQRELRAFLRDKGVTAIVVVSGHPGPWQELFGALDPSPEVIGGVTLYRVPRSVLETASSASGP